MKSNECSSHANWNSSRATLTRIWFDADLSICCLYRFFLFLFFFFLSFVGWTSLCNNKSQYSLFLFTVKNSFEWISAKFIISKNCMIFLWKKKLCFFFVVAILRLLNEAARVNHLDGTDNFSFRQLTISCPCSFFFCPSFFLLFGFENPALLKHTN